MYSYETTSEVPGTADMTQPYLQVGLGTNQSERLRKGLAGLDRRKLGWTKFVQLAKAAVTRVLTPGQRIQLDEFICGTESALVITGLPTFQTEDLDPRDSRPENLSPVADAVQIGVVGQVGHPVAYADERDGAVIHEIAVASKPTTSKSQSANALAVHSDRSRRPDLLQPDWLTLMGMRNPDGLATSYCGVEAALAKMPEGLGKILFEDRFDFESDGKWKGMRPILRTGIDGRLIVCLPPEELPCDPGALLAQHAFREAAIQAASGIVLQAGAMAIIRNRSTLHWRNTIHSPERWLRRVYGVAPEKHSQLVAERLINETTCVLIEN